jgi:hypothetical protein
MRIGITGHMNLAPETRTLVREALDTELKQYDPTSLIGFSCIAEGADALFAEAVLAAGGRLVAILPAMDYRDTRVSEAHLETFDDLVDRAYVTRYAAGTSSMQAYEEANAQMLGSVELMLAVWDGQPSPEWKKGGTADAVAAARSAGVPVKVIWPDGAARS